MDPIIREVFDDDCRHFFLCQLLLIMKVFLLASKIFVEAGMVMFLVKV